MRILAALAVTALIALAAYGTEYQVTVNSGLVYQYGDVFDVMAYGAKGDGTTDDTAAIQAAANAMKAHVFYYEGDKDAVAAAHKSATLVFPPGDYLITSPIFLGIAGQVYPDTVNYHQAANRVVGDGAVIIAQTSGAAALDMTGAMNFEMRGLTIMGSTTNSPNIGILLARGGDETTNSSAGNHRFFNVTTIGSFTLSAVYNYGSEINKWLGCYIRNDDGLAAIYMTSNNVRQAVTSASATIDTTYQSSYGDVFDACTISWYGAEAPRDTSSGDVVIESMSYGPKFSHCFFNMLRSAPDSTAGPYFRIKPAQGLAAATAGVTQGFSVTGSTFEDGASCVILAEGKLFNPVFRDNGGALGSYPFGDIYIIDSANAGIYGYDFQRDQGSTNVAALEVSIGAAGTYDFRAANLDSSDDLDDYIYEGTWAYGTSLPSNAPSTDQYGYVTVNVGSVLVYQQVTCAYNKGIHYVRTYTRASSTWGSWYKIGGNKVITATADDATPSVAFANMLVIPANTGATTITDLDDGVAGQVVTVFWSSATNPSALADGGNFALAGGAAATAGVGDTLTLVYYGTTWYEIGRADN